MTSERHLALVFCLSVSIAAADDGQSKVTGTTPELFVQTGHWDRISAMASSPDGQMLLTGSGDNTAILWDIATGNRLRTFAGHTWEVEDVAFSPDGKWVATASGDQTVCIWEAATGKKLRTLQANIPWVYTQGVDAVAFSPCGRYLLTGASDRSIILWDTRTGEKVRSFLGHEAGVTSVGFTSDGQKLLSASYDGTAILWDATNSKVLRKFKAPEHEGERDAIYYAALSPDGSKVLAGTSEKVAILWDTASGRQMRTFPGHSWGVDSVAFSPDGRRVCISGHESATMWDVTNGEKLHTLARPDFPITLVDFGEDGIRAVSSEYQVPILWDIASGKQLRKFRSAPNPVESLTFTPDGKGLLTAHWKTPVLWDAAPGKRLLRYKGFNWFNADILAVSPDGRWLAAACGGTGRIDPAKAPAPVVVWDANSGVKLQEFRGHTLGVNCLAFDPRGHRLAGGSGDKQAIIWDVATGKQLRVFTSTGEIHWLRFSADGRQLLANNANLWEVDTGKRLQEPPSDFVAAGFNPDAPRMSIGPNEGTVILRDPASNARLQTFAHANVRSVALSPDGRRLLTASRDRSTILWDTTTGHELARLFSFNSTEDWLIVTPQGYFDGSPEGCRRVTWRVGDKVFPLERYGDRFHRPDLLARCLAGEGIEE